MGQGVSQIKAHHAVVLAVLKLLTEQNVKLPGTLYFAFNNEGRSSHWCTEQILEALDPKPDFCLFLRGTGMRISLGNRGRVDVNMEIKGKASHSSAPGAGLSAIEGANEFLNRLKQLKLPGGHPILGSRHACWQPAKVGHFRKGEIRGKCRRSGTPATGGCSVCG